MAFLREALTKREPPKGVLAPMLGQGMRAPVEGVPGPAVAPRKKKGVGYYAGPHAMEGAQNLGDLLSFYATDMSDASDVKYYNESARSAFQNAFAGKFGAAGNDAAVAAASAAGMALPFIGLGGMAKAFQGSPHTYGRDIKGTKHGLDLSKIGTGEGAQAYGRGGYLAEARDVGEGYRKTTSFADLKRKFQDELPDDADFDEVLELAQSGAFGSKGREVVEALHGDDWLGFDYPSQAISAAMSRRIGDFDPSPRLRKAVDDSGHIYEYDVDDAAIEKMLDWDKPLSEQPESVKAAINSIYKHPVRVRKSDVETNKWIATDADGKYVASRPHDFNFEDLPGEYFGTFTGSDALREAGIPGVKYLDQMSRVQGNANAPYWNLIRESDGVTVKQVVSKPKEAPPGFRLEGPIDERTRNFVIFDEDIAKLTARDDVRFDTPELPMDEASRMARAKDGDFNIDAYHGTNDDVTSFDLDHPNRYDSGWLGEGVYATSDPGLASSYATLKSMKPQRWADPTRIRGQGDQVVPLKVRLKNPYMATLADKERIKMIEWQKGKEAAKAASKKWTDELKAKGHDGVILKYDPKDVGAANASTEYVVFDPKNIRSRFAKFDPAKKDSTDIMAGAAAIPLGAMASNDHKKRNRDAPSTQSWKEMRFDK